MCKVGVLLSYYLLAICILSMIFLCKTAEEDRKVHIVYMGALPEEAYSPSSHHFRMLKNVIGGSSAKNSLILSYNRSFNGFVANITDRESLKLASLKEVVSVFPSKNFHMQTTRSWDFMGLNKSVPRNPFVESDTIVGVIDSGIWPELESFNDAGFGPPPKKWKGACNGGKNFTCNNKVIGARFYKLDFSVSTSARDDVGHGTHTASTVAGSSVKDASFYGIAKGTARGGVPSARIAGYKVCGHHECPTHSILAAFDDAIADGVDIISMSLGHYDPEEFYRDPLAIGSFHAMEKGILTVNSAGNNGPFRLSVRSLAPWLLTVAASSMDRRIIDKVILGNGANIIGDCVNSFTLNGTKFPLIYGKKVSSHCTDSKARMCKQGCLDSGLVKGKIVVCDNYAGIVEAYRAGALGSIVGSGKLQDISFVLPLPASALNNKDYVALISYLNSTADPSATILKSEAMTDSAAPMIAYFSSRGPNLIAPDILKPDITAPGVDILAAFSPSCSPSGSLGDKRRVKYNIISGTSMSCPHVAGAAAYVKTFHPDWSPSAIKSSLMTTASVMKKPKDSNGEFDYGSGHVNPVKAVNPGLVYEADQRDYIQFLCSIGYNESNVRLIAGDNSSCPEGSGKLLPKDLNYPSMTAQVSKDMKAFMVQFHRRVKNVGFSNSTYKAEISPQSTLDIRVVPAVLSFVSLNEEKSFDVIVKCSTLSSDSMVSASLVWSDGTHFVTSPIVLHSIKTSRT